MDCFCCFHVYLLYLAFLSISHIVTTEFCQPFNVPFVSLTLPFIVLSHNVHTTNRASKVYSIYVAWSYLIFAEHTRTKIWVLRSEITTFHGHKEESSPLQAQLKTIMFSRLKVYTDFWLSLGVKEKSIVNINILLIEIKLNQFPNAHRDNLVTPSLFRQMQQTGFWPSVVQSIGAGRRKLSDSSIAYTPPAVLL